MTTVSLLVVRGRVLRAYATREAAEAEVKRLRDEPAVQILLESPQEIWLETHEVREA